MYEISDSKFQRRPHLTKEQRVPKCFKEVEKIIKSVKSCKKNYKTVLANSRLRGSAHKKVYSLTVNVLKNYNYIQKIIDKIQLLEKEKYLRREIASVLIYEMIFGNGTLPGESKVVATIQLHENDIRYAHEVLQSTDSSSLATKDLNIPRYVRVHTLVTTVPYVINDLKSYGFKQILYEEGLLEEKFYELVRNLENGCFLIDFHFKDILVFEHSENLINLDLYKNGHIFLQDKSSYIPVHILDPEPTSGVLDACAAPGIKTVHIASKMKNKGILYACERDKSRFESLKQMLDYGSVKICRTLCKDFKLIDPNDQAYSSIEYILLDPSCSGSGMVNRLDEVTDTENSKNKERLMKLAGFQIILLKHALKFPSVKRVVYSTCSIHEEENEYVVHEVLNSCNGIFKLAAGMSKWSQRGSENFEFGKLCIRTVPEKHLTNGFFVAMFERVNEYTEEKCISKYYKGKEMYVEKSENIHFGEVGSSTEKQNGIPSKFKKKNEMRTVTETPGGFSHNGFSKSDNYCDRNSKSEHDSLFYHKIDGTDMLDVINKNVESIEDSNENISGQKNINLDYVQKQKHKKIRDTHSIVHKDTHNSNFHEKNDRIDILDNVNKVVESVEDTNEYVIGEKNPLNLDYVQEKNKHKKKKKKKKSGELLNDFNELEQNVPKELSESQLKNIKLKEIKSCLSETERNDIDYVEKDECKQKKSQSVEVSEQLADVTTHKKKKKRKKYLELEGTFSFESKHSDKTNELQQKLPNAILDPHTKHVKLKENNDIFLHNTDCTSIHRKDKHKQSKHFETISDYAEIVEDHDVESSHRKKKKRKEHLNEPNEVQQKLFNTLHKPPELMKSNNDSQFYQKIDGTYMLDVINKNVECIEDSNENVMSEQKKVNLDYVQKKKLKKKKMHDSHTIDHEDTHNSDGESINKKSKHKQKKHLKNTPDSIEVIADFVNVTSLHKTKRKKHLEMGCM